MNGRRAKAWLLALYSVALVLVGCDSPIITRELDKGRASHTSEARNQANSQHHPTVSLGFNFATDALPYINWAPGANEKPIGTQSMIDLFGASQVCINYNPINCVPNGASIKTAEKLNNALSTGYCEGMVVAAAMNYASRISGKTRPFWGTKSQLSTDLAELSMTQIDPDIQQSSTKTRSFKPSELANDIYASIRDKRIITMGIYSTNFAHAVLPISARWENSNLIISVYDPNFPTKEQVLSIDTKNESWRYSGKTIQGASQVAIGGYGPGGIDYAPLDLRVLPMNLSIG